VLCLWHIMTHGILCYVYDTLCHPVLCLWHTLCHPVLCLWHTLCHPVLYLWHMASCVMFMTHFMESCVMFMTHFVILCYVYDTRDVILCVINMTILHLSIAADLQRLVLASLKFDEQTSLRCMSKSKNTELKHTRMRKRTRTCTRTHTHTHTHTAWVRTPEVPGSMDAAKAMAICSSSDRTLLPPSLACTTK
jgi:hypothetical protein